MVCSWDGGIEGDWGDECSFNGGDEKRPLPNFLQPFFENLSSKDCYDGSRDIIPVFHNPHRKCRPSPSTVACTLVYFVGVPSSAASSGREEKQVWINIQKVREYLEGGN